MTTSHILSKPLLAMITSVLLLSGCSSSQDPNSLAAKNLAAGTAFLTKNATRPEVKTLESGLQYEVLQEGSGKQPKLADWVNVRYRGMHLDGTVFSESDLNNEPEMVSVKNSLIGWRLALLNMKVGSKWRIYLPPRIAYSNRGVKGMVEPNETVIYELELKSIVW